MANLWINCGDFVVLMEGVMPLSVGEHFNVPSDKGNTEEKGIVVKSVVKSQQKGIDFEVEADVVSRPC